MVFGCSSDLSSAERHWPRVWVERDYWDRAAVLAGWSTHSRRLHQETGNLQSTWVCSTKLPVRPLEAPNWTS